MARFKAMTSGYGQAVVIDTTKPVAAPGRIVATFSRCDCRASLKAAAAAAKGDTVRQVIAAVKASGLPADIHVVPQPPSAWKPGDPILY